MNIFIWKWGIDIIDGIFQSQYILKKIQEMQ